MFRTPSRRQQMFREALSREPGKTRKGIDRGAEFRKEFPYGVMLLWLSFFGVMGYVLLFSPYLFITQVKIEGAKQISDQEIQDVVEPLLGMKRFLIFPARNFFLVPEEKMKKNIITLSPVLESVQFEKIFPHTLRIISHEREELLLWCAGGPCTLLGENDMAWFHEKAFENRYDPIRLMIVDTSGLPFNLGTQLPVKDYLNYFSLFQHEISKIDGLSAERQAFTPSRFSRELRITTSSGWILFVNIDIPMDETFLSLKAFLDERAKILNQPVLTTVDMRVPGRIFFTEAGSDEVKNETNEETINEKQDKKEDINSKSAKKKRSE